MVNIAIIGGTGVYNPKMLDNVQEIIQPTEYGEVKVMIGDFEGTGVAFIPRHGMGHSLPPHLINYRANIMALNQLGVQNILATAAVGSLNYEFKPGHIVLANQFIDFTKSRNSTFYDGGEKGVIHCDMTVPYCSELREVLEKTGSQIDIPVYNGGTYVCTEGPRFETAAEIDMFKAVGGHLVGMTSVPEVCLARELGMCYANISIITNFAAGISPHRLTHSEVVEIMKQKISDIRILMIQSLKHITENKECDCNKILEETGVNT